MRYDEWAAIGHANGWLGVRARDPHTSTEGAKAVKMRAGSQRVAVLSVYANGNATDEEAGIRSGLAALPKCGYWKRCSELRSAGFIRPTGEVRSSTSGASQQVCEITEEGRLALAEAR